MKCVKTALVISLFVAFSIVSIYAAQPSVRIDKARVSAKGNKSDIPHEINYQGCLEEGDNPVNATLDMSFSIWTASTSGDSLWGELHSSVEVKKGIFNVILGTTEAIPSSIFTSTERWLQMKIGTEIFSPRTKLTSIGYSFTAGKADSADNATKWNNHQWGDKYPQSTYADTAQYAVIYTHIIDSIIHAINADSVRGISASSTPLPNHLYPLDENGFIILDYGGKTAEDKGIVTAFLVSLGVGMAVDYGIKATNSYITGIGISGTGKKIGVEGISDAGTGVLAQSENGYALYAISNGSLPTVFARNASFCAIKGIYDGTGNVNAIEGIASGGYAGVSGKNTKTSGGGPGVYGESVSGIGIHGKSGAATAIKGEYTGTGNFNAIEGVSSGPYSGVSGVNIGSSGGPGVYCKSSSGPALHADGKATFAGDVTMQKNLTLNGADFNIKYSPRGSGGRALVHGTGNQLLINYGNDFTGAVRFGSNIHLNGHDIKNVREIRASYTGGGAENCIEGIANGSYAGVAGKNTGNGPGVYGESQGNDAVYGTSVDRYGVYGTSVNWYGVGGQGANTGVRGNATNTSGNRSGGSFTSNGGGTASVGAVISGVNYKIYGTGLVSTIMLTREGKKILFAPESPEPYFEDFGQGQLSNGHCHIELDYLFVDCIKTNAKHSLKVFIQLNDDCNGVYVKTGATGFDVYELQSGKSNASFTYRVVANRKDTDYLRLPVAVEPEEISKGR